MRLPSSRSRVTNGSKLLPTVPGSSVWARLLRDNLDAVIVHLGGWDVVSEPQRMAARRVAVFETELVHLEDKIGQERLAGREPDERVLELYTRLANSQRRFCEALGWQRMPKDIVPSLASYLEAKRTPTGEQN